MINDTFLHDCTSQSQIHWYLGDGICQIQLNNIENLFDAGDCCLDSPECQLITMGLTPWDVVTVDTTDIECPEHVCIKSDVSCIEEFKGDGICDDFNNSHLCEFDLRDCCGPYQYLNGALDTCCKCHCLPVMNFPLLT